MENKKVWTVGKSSSFKLIVFLKIGNNTINPTGYKNRICGIVTDKIRLTSAIVGDFSLWHLYLRTKLFNGFIKSKLNKVKPKTKYNETKMVYGTTINAYPA